MIKRLSLFVLLWSGTLITGDFAKKKAALKSIFAKKVSSAQDNFVGYTVPIEAIKIDVSPEGYPTLNAVKNLMEKNFFPSKDGSVIVNEIKMGSYNDKIYSIAVSKGGVSYPAFFLKISTLKRGQAADRLLKIQQGKIGRLGLTNHYNDANPILRRYLPIIVWLEKIYKYKDNQGREHIMELSHAAHGEQVSNIINTKSLAKVAQCVYCVGRALGSFQQVFIKYVDKQKPETWLTVAHKDLHGGNIFFDKKTQKVYFIDNETMSDNNSIFEDVDYFIDRLGRIDFKEESFNSINVEFSFLKGYLESYPKSQRCLIATVLEEPLLNKVASEIKSFDVSSWLTDQERSVEVYRFFMSQYIDFLKSNIMTLGPCGVSGVNNAVFKGNYNDVELLLRNAADHSDKNGTTPLFWALEKNDSQMLALLKRNKVGILQATKLFPRGVLEYFVLIDNDKVLKTFIDVMKPAQNILELLLVKASLYGSLSSVKLLLSLGVNVNSQVTVEAKKVLTPLYCAASKAQVAVVQELLRDKDLNVNSLDWLGRNPLLRLAENVLHFSNKQKADANIIAKMLMSVGSDVSLKNREGKTAFDIMPQWASYPRSTPAQKDKDVPANSKELVMQALELSSLLKK